METISMSSSERRRLEVFSRVSSGELGVIDASKLLRLSYRQTLRVWQRYQQEGDAGLVHKGRGRPSNRQPAIGLQEHALTLYREHYQDYGPTLAAECLTQVRQLPSRKPSEIVVSPLFMAILPRQLENV